MSRNTNRPGQSRAPPRAGAPTPAKRERNPAWVALPILVVVLGGIAVAISTGAFRPDPARQNLLQDSNHPPTAATAPGALDPAVATPGKAAAAPLPLEAELGPTEKSAHHQNQGNEFLKVGQFAAAVAEYRQAVAITPEDEDAHYNLAFALAKSGDKEGAEKEYREALRIYADYTEAHNNLGNLLLSNGKVAEAVTEFQAAIKLTADDPMAHNNLGHALALQGKYTEALVALKEALRLKPDYLEARQNLGVAYLQMQRGAEALAVFEEILRGKPDFEPALKGRARAQKLVGP